MLLLVLIAAGTLYALRHPWVGAMGWALVSLMSPHAEFGYRAANWPVATGIALATLTGLLFTKERVNPFAGAAPKFLLAFTVWACITLPFSLAIEPSLQLWERSMKIYLMVFVTLALVDEKRKLQVFIWINVISIGYFGVKGGVFTLLTGGNFRVWGPGGFIQGNNEVALAVITMLPLIRFLQAQMTRSWAIHAATVAMLLCVATALGTHSRGALVGLICMGSVFWLKSNNKVVGAVLIVTIVLVGLPMMPEHWWTRMATIEHYEQDVSAMGRINAWWMAYNLANARLFGGGFMVSTDLPFKMYAPDPNAVHAAHSIYFQVLGEHGYIGLLLFLGIGAATWLAARDLARISRQHPQHKWVGDLGAMVQVSMIGYASAGAFLSLAYYDLPYNVMVMAVVAQRLVLRELAQSQAAAARATPPAGHAGHLPIKGAG